MCLIVYKFNVFKLPGIWLMVFFIGLKPVLRSPVGNI